MRDEEFSTQVLSLAPRLRQRARAFTRHDPEDLVQETLLRAWRAWGGSEIENVWGWLWLILRNTFYDTRRDARRWRETAEAHSPEIAEVRATPPRSPDEGLLSGPDDRTLEAVRQLTTAQRTVIELGLMGIDDQTAASQLKIDVKTVRTAKWKARQSLRAML